uniref:Uncharacterized protein n=1 Tax=Pristionchus pacificus TaxID=54126 RepID=A0A2A6CZT5_PRIPA|eukprot:PDM83543.1 hypothetical protein PRIPAC_30030 [Pristionchus pacificus]
MLPQPGIPIFILGIVPTLTLNLRDPPTLYSLAITIRIGLLQSFNSQSLSTTAQEALNRSQPFSGITGQWQGLRSSSRKRTGV